MGYKYTYDDVKNEFENRNYILITDHKVKSNEKYEYICKKHQDKGSQFITWGHFYCNNRGCYYCGRERSENARKKDLSEYDGKSLAESKGFEYFGIVRRNKKVLIQFICPKHRQYGVQEMPYNNMKRVVVGCQHCIGRNDSEQEVLLEMKKGNPHIVLLEPYIGRTKPIMMRCLLHGIECRKTPAEVIDGGGCYFCGLNKIKRTQLLSQEEFETRVRHINPHIYIKGQYTGAINPINCYCLKHNINFTRIAVSLYNNNSGCDECHKDTIRRISGLTKEKYIEKLQYNFPYVDLLGSYINLQEKTEFYCNQCETLWLDKPILVHNRGCINCENNRTENIIGKILDIYNIKYERQYTFDDCVDKRKLPFDYFLIDYNILCEYDGEQHYKPIDFFGGEEKFKQRQHNDQIKTILVYQIDTSYH